MCKSAWTAHTSKLRATLLAVSRSLGNSEAGTDLKIGNMACRELPLLVGVINVGAYILGVLYLRGLITGGTIWFTGVWACTLRGLSVVVYGISGINFILSWC